jgi:DNA-binding MarR family transcriptional regulator
VIEDEGETLAEAFRGVSRQLRRASRDVVAPWDVTPGHARALSVLLHHGVMRLNELSDHLRIAPRSTTEVVDALEDRGLIERRPDPGDRRATLVALTDEGLRAGEAMRAAQDVEGERFFSILSTADRARLGAILRKLRA